MGISYTGPHRASHKVAAVADVTETEEIGPPERGREKRPVIENEPRNTLNRWLQLTTQLLRDLRMHGSLEAGMTKEIVDQRRRFRTPLLQVERGSYLKPAGTLFVVAIR